VGKVLYECPVCKTHNPDDARNCYKCGHWMLSTNYPAKRIVKKSAARVAVIVVLSVVGGVMLLFTFLIVIGLFLISDNESATTQVIKTEQKNSNYGSRSNPVPLGTRKELSVKQYFALTGVGDNKYSLSFKLNRVIRGSEALEIVKEWNEFNSVPSDGSEYMLVEMNIEVLKSSSDNPADINTNTFSLVSENGVKYDPTFVADAKDDIYKKLYEGASHTGWAIFSVKIDDVNPLIDIAGTWFSLK
jgi:hypothetical protein